MKKIILILIVVFFSNFSYSTENEINIVINKNVPIKTINYKLIKNIFLGKKTKWNNDKSIVIVMLKKGKTHQYFTEKILEIPPEKLARIWKRAFFAGTGNLPKICDSENELIEYVKKISGAIGYVGNKKEIKGITKLKISKI